MFGITPLGWVHTLGSLPAIPAAVYLFGRHGRIVPRSRPGTVFFGAMLVGAVTVFPIAHAVASKVVALVTLGLLLLGYGVGRTRLFGRATRYIEVVSLSFTTFLLMLPTVSEILRRVPDGHPLAPDLNSPLLKFSQGGLLLLLLVGVTAQVLRLNKGEWPDDDARPDRQSPGGAGSRP